MRAAMNRPGKSPSRTSAGLVLALLASAAGCEVNRNYYTTVLEEAGAPVVGSAGAGGADPYPGAPEPDSTPEEHDLDLFGAVGHRFWLAVSEEQLALMNERAGGGPVLFDWGQDLYAPGDAHATYVDHLYVTAAGDGDQTADYGQVEVRLLGHSTLRPWNRRSLPTLRIDADEFAEGVRIGGFEHLRLNNGQVGSIFREKLTLELYRRLGVPVPLATFVWVESNVWGPDVAVPYTLVEVYKQRFCDRNAERLGGGCANLWELVGDFAQGDGGPIPIDAAPPGLPVGLPSLFDDPENCQLDECDPTRVKELEARVAATAPGEGFKAALADFIDWDAYHRFQCLSWILATGDDAIHGQNNVLIVERADGPFEYLPYSVDISLGQEWYYSVPLVGTNRLSTGCQADPICWADTVAACEGAVEEFVAADPVALLEADYAALAEAGMLRDGDDARHEGLRAWLEQRLLDLPHELEQSRPLPGVCPAPLVDCGGWCGLVEECGSCVPPGGEPLPPAGEGGASGAVGDGGLPAACEPVRGYALE